MTEVFISIVNNWFTHMKTNGNIAILCCFLCLQAIFSCWLSFLWLSFLYFPFVFNAIFTIWHQLSVCYKYVKIIFDILCMSYYFEDIVNGKSIKFSLNNSCMLICCRSDVIIGIVSKEVCPNYTWLIGHIWIPCLQVTRDLRNVSFKMIDIRATERCEPHE